MNTAALPSRNISMPGRNMSGPMLASLLFHFLVVLVLITGLPFLHRKQPDIMAEPMTVELMTVDEAAQTNRPPLLKPRPEELQKPPEAPPKPQPPQVTAKTPPKPVAPEKPEPEEFVKAPPEEKAEKAEIVEKPKPVDPPKPKQRPVLTREPETKEEQEQFQSLLRNLMPSEPATPAEKTPDAKAESTPSPQAPLSQAMTSTEMSSLASQLRQCWSILAGARYAEDLVVDIKLFVNADRTVRDAQIVDKIRYMSDGYYRAAADGAMRAVLNPRCNPLDLPPDKYDRWKEIIVTFDPSDL